MVPCIAHLIDVLEDRRTHWVVGEVAPPAAVWTSLQAELALEKFFWGRLDWQGMNWRDYALLKRQSVLLGPGQEVHQDVCRTDRLGFLALSDQPEQDTLLAAEMPPPTLWTKHWMQQRMMTRIWEVRRAATLSSHSFGKVAIEALVEELACYSWADEDKCRRLYLEGRTETVLSKLKYHRRVQVDTKVPGTNWMVDGHIGIRRLAEKMFKAKYVIPMVFGKMVRACGRQNVEKDLENGIRTLQLKYFPKFESRHAHHPKAYWTGKQVYYIDYPEMQQRDARTWGTLTDATKMIKGLLVQNQVLLQVDEVNSLDHLSVFPWLGTIKDRLGRMQPRDMKIHLTVLSAIALMQNAIPVDQQALSVLMKLMTVSQAELQALHILGQYPVSTTRNILRLHHDIEYRIPQRTPPRRPTRMTPAQTPPVFQFRVEPEPVIPEPQRQPQTGKRRHEDDHDTVLRPGKRRSTDLRAWTPEETRLVAVSIRDYNEQTAEHKTSQFNIYLDLCRRTGIEPRNQTAYKFKRARMAQKKKNE